MGSDEAKLRRYKNDLYVSGLGTILMGAWNIFKSILEIILIPEYSLITDSDDPTTKILMTGFTILIFAVVLALIMMIHFYVGFNAIKAAKDMDHKKGYIIMAAVLFVLTLAGFLYYYDDDPDDVDTTIASILVDITTLYILGAVMLSSFKIKKMKELQVQE